MSGVRPRPWLEKTMGERPAALRRGDRVRACARETARALLGTRRGKTPLRTQGLPCVVRHLAGPDEIPKRRKHDLRIGARLAHQVEPEQSTMLECRAHSLMHLALRRSERGGPAERRRVFPEIDRHALEPGTEP